MSEIRSINLTPIDGRHLRSVVEYLERRDDEAGLQDIPIALRNSPVRAFQDLLLNRNAGPLRSILQSLTSRWNVVAVHESPYMDLEFWDSHGGLYEHCFTPYPRECERLHFFSSERAGESIQFASSLVEVFSAGKSWNEVRETWPEIRYHGYTVFRPVPSWNVSRTAVTFDDRAIDDLPSCVHVVPEEKSGTPRLTISAECRAHLLNAVLRVPSVEFIQQDPNLGACAPASLWVATRRISSSDSGVAKFPYSAITTQAIGAWSTQAVANSSWDPTAGDTAFSAEQIKTAVTQCGWHCVEVNPIRTSTRKAKSERLRFTILSYLDSGYPVLLLMVPYDGSPGHVVAAVGYCSPGDVAPSSIIPVRDFHDGEELSIDAQHVVFRGNVRVLYAHDDAYGPFNRVVYPAPDEQSKGVEAIVRSLGIESEEQLKKANLALQNRIQRLRNDTCPLLKVSRIKQKEMRLTRVLVPVPRDVRADVSQILDDAITRFDESVKPRIAEARDYRFLWRCVLAHSAEFKASLGHPKRRLSDELRGWYGRLHLPKYIWVAEVTVLKSHMIVTHYSDPDVWFVDGEFLYDATAPFHAVSWISGRVRQLRTDWRCSTPEWTKVANGDNGLVVERFAPNSYVQCLSDAGEFR